MKKINFLALAFCMVLFPCVMAFYGCDNPKVDGFVVEINGEKYSTTNNTVINSFEDEMICNFGVLEAQIGVYLKFSDGSQDIKMIDSSEIKYSGDIRESYGINEEGYVIKVGYKDYEPVEIIWKIIKKPAELI